MKIYDLSDLLVRILGLWFVISKGIAVITLILGLTGAFTFMTFPEDGHQKFFMVVFQCLPFVIGILYLLWRLPLPKLPRLSGSKVCKILIRNGFEKARQRGSHIIMQKHIDNTTVTVPVPDHKELRRSLFPAPCAGTRLLHRTGPSRRLRLPGPPGERRISQE